MPDHLPAAPQQPTSRRIKRDLKPRKPTNYDFAEDDPEENPTPPKVRPKKKTKHKFKSKVKQDVAHHGKTPSASKPETNGTGDNDQDGTSSLPKKAKNAHRTISLEERIRATEEQAAQAERDVEEAYEDSERMAMLHIEKQQNARRLILVEEQNRIHRAGSRERARFLRPEDVVPDAVDDYAHYYEEYTGNWFWRLVHPPIVEQTKRTPPDMQRAGGIPRWIGRVTTSWPERVLLAQLVYYFQLSRRTRNIRAKRRRNGHLWVYKDDRTMCVETMINSVRTLQACRSRLKARGIIIVEYHRAPIYRAGCWLGLKVCHYRIDWDVLGEKYEQGGGCVGLLGGEAEERRREALFRKGKDDPVDDRYQSLHDALYHPPDDNDYDYDVDQEDSDLLEDDNVLCVEDDDDDVE
jgi:hypothetical protein